MDFFKGQKLELLHDSLDVTSDPESTKVLFPAGTEVVIENFVDTPDGKVVAIKFPDGLVYGHRMQDMAFLFANVTQSNTLHKIIKGMGTPPRSFFPYMPPEAKWDRNYFYTISITMEETGRKSFICQDCYTELLGTEDARLNGIMCPQCGELKKPVAVDSIIPREE
jgi:hypothetical protein